MIITVKYPVVIVFFIFSSPVCIFILLLLLLYLRLHPSSPPWFDDGLQGLVLSILSTAIDLQLKLNHVLRLNSHLIRGCPLVETVSKSIPEASVHSGIPPQYGNNNVINLLDLRL